MENNLYIAIMYAKNKNITKVIRIFLVSPIKKQGLLKEHIIGFKEIVTNKELIKNGKDINNKKIIWQVQPNNMIPSDEIIKYINKSNEEMLYIIEESKLKANEFIKKRTI